MADTGVWYVAYGSNLSAERFRCYLEGGRPDGARRAHPPSRDPRPPTDDRPLRLPHALRFGGRSRNWGGGVAFVRPGRGGETLGRAYRLTRIQLEDVYARENGRPGPLDLPAEAWDGPVHDLDDGPYRSLVRLEDLDGEPAYTITGPPPGDRTPPAPAYLRYMATGLVDSHGMSPRGVADHLRQHPEVASSFSAEDILALIDMDPSV